MSDQRLLDEEEYFRVRETQLLGEAEQRGISRRSLLRAAALGLPLLGGAASWPLASALADTTPTTPTTTTTTTAAPPGPIVKPLPPEWFTILGTNAEMRWDSVAGQPYETANERFFVRNHTATPLIDASTWQLSVFGSGLRGAPDVDHPRTFSYRDLRRMPSREVTAFVECAGNGRSFFASQQGTPAPGSQWTLGAIGVARWRGVPLSYVLRHAGLDPWRAVDVMPQGLDNTVVTNGVDTGHVRRPLPIAKALHDALLVYEMNGQILPPDHGFPVRLLVPGWVGVANIKWLGQIEVADEPLFSPWNTTQYRLLGAAYPPDSPPLTNQAVKSAFELPFGATFASGTRVVLTGRSWSGLAPIRHVDISTDGGTTWNRAWLKHPNLPNAWVRWSFAWTPPAAGSYQLMARATDYAGRTQPATVPFNDLGYLFWAIVKHPVTVT
jgi:DMSO/TMAO reductase YedYZ molybdopterin-dependent catalytic subunit